MELTMGGNNMKEIIIKKANKYRLPPQLVRAIIKVESSNNNYAIRYEKNYRWLYKPEKFAGALQTLDTEKYMQKCSLGLMQVMGAVAREHGCDDTFLSKLFDPEINLEYGCKYLSILKRRFGDMTDCIAAYNAGSPRKLDDGSYVNQKYVDRVLKNWK